MNECPYCGFQNPADIHICLGCASSLKRYCPNCKAEVLLSNRVCGQCGGRLEFDNEGALKKNTFSSELNLQERMLHDLRSKMPSSLVSKFAHASRDLYGQRREVTVLNVEIADYKSVAKKIDSERLYMATDEIVHLLANVIYKYEGTIDKYTGSGLLALFGIPLNHENDPERAVRAALEMQYTMTQLRDDLIDRYGQDFQIQIGINTGSVIAGNLGDQNHIEYTVIGDTVHLAGQLQRFAASGTVLVSFQTYQRSRPIIDFQSLPLQKLEGHLEPIKIFQAIGIRLTPGQLRGLPGLQVPMIGRSEQLEKLIEIFKQVINTNTSQIVFCSGDAGIGKSRLMAEFKNYLSSQPVTMVQGTCASYMRITPYRVVADVVRNILSISELDSAAEQRKVLHRRLEKLGLDRDDIAPYLMHVLGLLQSDPVMDVRIKLLEPSMLRRQTHFALRIFFIAESRLSPLILVFDDLHWVDQASGHFLEYICQSLEDSPLILIMVARDFGKFGLAQSIQTAASKHIRKPHELHIQPLSVSDTHLLVDQLVHEKTKSAKRLKDLITIRAGGNPYYTEELVRILIDHAGLSLQDGQWCVADTADKIIQEVPGTLRDIILARFDHLPNTLKQILLRASILGDSFSIRLLQAIMKQEIVEITDSLMELEERDFLVHTKFDVEEGYVFKHPLLQETIYKTVLHSDLRKLHAKVAEAIEAGDYWLPRDRNQVLAYHLSEGTNPEKAIPFLLISAEEAYRHFANDTVVQLYRRAIVLMETVADIPVGTKEQAMVGLARALKFTGDLVEAAQVLTSIVDQIPKIDFEHNPSLFPIQIEAVRELADIRAREGNLDYAVQLLKQGMDLLGDLGRNKYPNIWRRLADRLAWVYFRQRNLEEAYNLVDLALLDTATWEAEDPITMASLYNTIGGIYWTRSRYADAIDSVEHSLAIYKNLHYHWGIANALTNLGVLHFSTEKWSYAVDYLEQADRLREAYGDDPERPVNLKNLGEVLIDMGEYQNARLKLETSRDISLRLGLDFAQAFAEFGLCRLAITEGDLSKARLHLEGVTKLIGSLDEINDRVSHYYQLEALIKIEESDFQNAKKSAEKAFLVSKQGSMKDKQVDALRILGKVNAKLKLFDQAEKCLYNSVELAQELSDRFSEAKARYELGLLFLNWCERDSSQLSEYLKQAERSLDASIRIFEELGAKSDLQRAKNARALLPALENSNRFSEDQKDTRKQIDILQTNLHQVDSGLYRATIIFVVLSPRQGMDDELIFETIAFLIPPMIHLIHENGGQVIRDQDGIYAIFGGLVSHEDDSERAVETVLQVINYYNELSQQTELSVSIHIGITMGEIVGGKVDLEQASEFMVVGEPVQLARRIAGACPSGGVWVDQSIRNLTSFRFEYAPVSPSLTEDLPDISLFQLQGLREQMLPVRGLIGLKSPFIGRKKELDVMHQMSLVLDGQTGGIIWIEGEAGIGKSRLMREFSNQLIERGALVLSGVCTIRRSDYAFSLFSDLLFKTFDIQHNFSPNQINAQLDQYLNRFSPELLDTRPFLQLLMGVHPSGAQGEQIATMEPEQLRRQTFVAIHRLMSVMASRQPLVIILDDLQWIDSISADLLLYLSHQVMSQPVLMVCAQRHKEISPFEQILARTRSMHPDKIVYLSIKPLTIRECQQLLSEFLASADLPDSIISLIVQQSGGNPYYIEEFVRLLVEKDFLRIVQGRLVANRTINIDSLDVPTSLESLIRARIDSLETLAKQILQVASVIGHRFNRALLTQVAERDEIDVVLAVLHTRGMLNPTSEEDNWEFSHPLIEVIVYNTIFRAQRRILHHRTATLLELLWQGTEGEHAEDLAYHFGKAEIHDKALHYLILAGERAASRHANDVAVSYFEQAAEQLSAVSNVSDEDRWRIIRGMGEVYQFIGNYETSLAVLQSDQDLINNPLLSLAQRAGLYRRMGDTAHKKGDQEQAILFLQQALEVMGEPTDIQSQAEAALIYARLGWCLFLQSDLEKAKEAVVKSRQYASEANSITTLAMTENHLGGIMFRQGELQQAMHHTRTAMGYWQEIGYSWGVAAALSNLGILESASGNLQAAFNAIKRSLELRQKMGDVDGVAITNHNLGNLARDQGDVQQAELYYRDSLAVSRPFQMNWHAANSYVGLAQSLLYQGKIEEASESLQNGFRLAQEINAPDVIVEAHCTSAEIYLACEDFAESENSARKAVDLAHEIGVSDLWATAWRLMAASLLGQKKALEASQALEKAWQALSDGLDTLEDGRLHVQAMLVALATDDLEKAKSHRESADRIFKRLGASRDRAVLEAIESP